MQPKLQVTDGVAAQVLQLHKATHSSILNNLLLVSWDDESQFNYCRELREQIGSESSQAASSGTLR